MPSTLALSRALLLLLVVSSLSTVASAEMTVNLGGRIHLDAALYDEDVTELGSGTEFRRARLFASGDIDEDWGYKLQLEFSDGDAELKDAFASYSGFRYGTIKIGQFKAPFSLEEMDSSKYITFMERGSNAIFVPGRRIGVGIENKGGRTTYAVSLVGNEAEDNSGDESLGVSARVTTSPKFSDRSFAHFGLGFNYEEPSQTGSDGEVRFRARPESHVTSSRLVDGGTITDVSNLMRVGLEAAYANGGFSAQAEYITVAVDAAGGDVDYDGFYAYASYFPWGGHRPYKGGVFGRVKANKTWEFALRYSAVDLSDTNGGEMNNITLGANYYVNPYLRFMANYIISDVENGPNGDEDPSIFQMRVSWDFK